MKKSILKEINSLFETGEIETIKFSKTGKTTVKYKKEPKVIQYSKSQTILQTIRDHAELSKIVEAVTMKPKTYTFEGSFIMPVEKQEEVMQKLCDLANKSMINIEVETGSFTIVENETEQTKTKSRFERFYDAVGNWLSNGKSFAPGELKTFA